MIRLFRPAMIALAALLAACAAQPAVTPNLDVARQAFMHKDFPTAYAHLKPLAEGGNAEAERLLGFLYRNGWGAPADKAAAVSWWVKAAAAGDTPAALALGNAYMNGDIVPQDDGAAFQWFKQAAADDNPGAEVELGYLYMTGRGVAKDLAQAITWTMRAAEQGDSVALSNIAIAYKTGVGLPRNPRKALFWAAVALQRSRPEEHDRMGRIFDSIAVKLSLAEVNKTRLAASTWAPSKDGLASVHADAAKLHEPGASL